jgi:hypothetical protein
VNLLARRRIVAAAFPTVEHPRISWSAHEAARTPERLDAAIAFHPEGTEIARDRVREALKIIDARIRKNVAAKHLLKPEGLKQKLMKPLPAYLHLTGLNARKPGRHTIKPSAPSIVFPLIRLRGDRVPLPLRSPKNWSGLKVSSKR